MPGTVFQYWRVTLPFAGAQEEAAEELPELPDDDEQPASTAMLATAVTAAARRTREAVFLMGSFQAVQLQRWTGRR
jgi:hypothetical protein